MHAHNVPNATVQVLSRVRSIGGTSCHQSGAYGASNQRLILPATSQPIPIQPQPAGVATMRTSAAMAQQVAGHSGQSMGSLAPGTTINVQTVGGGMQGFALVPAHYVTQVRVATGMLSTLPRMLWLAESGYIYLISCFSLSVC